MARASWILIVASLILGRAISVAAGDKAGELIHIAGKVLCQDCTKGYVDWSNGGRPIKGCKVSLTCMDERSRVMHYDSDETDDKGQFNMIVNKYMMNGKQLKEKLCKVRLVSSPDQTCNILTNFAGGKSGVNLNRPTLMYRDIVKYTLNPLFFTSPMCDQPDTHDDEPAYEPAYDNGFQGDNY